MLSNEHHSDPLIRASKARQEWGGISPVTEWRWRQRGIITPTTINGRNYYRRSTVERIKGRA